MITDEIKYLTTLTKNKKLSHYKAENQLVLNNHKRNVSEFLSVFRDDLVKNQIRYLFATFSGGHDEGGYDSFSYLDINKSEVIVKESESNWYKVRQLVKRAHLNRKKEEVKWDVFYYDVEKCLRLKDFDLEHIFYGLGALDRFGSFAGEFSVNGEVLLDILTGKYKVSGSESVEEWTNISEEGEIQLKKQDHNATV